MKRYYFNTEKYNDILDKYYPMSFKSIDFNLLTNNNLNHFITEFEEVINNPIIIDEKEQEFSNEQITCFSDNTNKILNNVFSDNDLIFFGHGGRAKEIIETEFHCHYPNLQSHFVMLECTNQSLSMLKNWPHLNSKQIAILALNKHELNPIYKIREQLSTYDTDIYSIPNEYFVGYYNAEDDTFVINSNFKKRHEYDKTCKIYPIEEIEEGLKYIEGPNEVTKICRELQVVGRIMYFSSNKMFLDEIGYNKIKKQLMYKIKKIKEIQNSITPELFDEYKTTLNNNDENDFNFDTDDNWIDDWEIETDNKSINIK